MTTPQNPQPFLSLHTAVVLLITFIIGVVMGTLTVLTGAPVAGAVAAGLTSAGARLPALRNLIR
ncbi:MULTISPECIES: hypothetical protein [unclassified Streptomyces]|uniref:hypothetical protein n=1 Tax=unclassified Streptomyces TaxID=2593676 RepID=UPI00093F6ACE|nr:hypothetical protein [Streptomyces sp. CB01883]OKJ80712.1 hypothetical protein AMK32_23345 [Streptomyces sp. CB01883]